MTNHQKDVLKMYQAVRDYLNGGGSELLLIVALNALKEQLVTNIGLIEDEQLRQGKATTGTSKTREDVKTEAAIPAEELRNLALGMTDDEVMRQTLKRPLSKVLNGEDAVFVAYLGTIIEAIGEFTEQQLEDNGYDATDLTKLTAYRQTLITTTGATRQIKIETGGATDSTLR